MSSITINSNIAALSAQRRFDKSTALLNDSFSRLSSGLRINHARDDASGLAISEDLKVDARVFQQGRRNVNDAISLLNIAEGAISQLSSITIRQRELASQAANGTLSSEQREALDNEANALVDEYNRIVRSTAFNNIELVDGNFGALRVQAGYGSNGSVSFSLGEDLARIVGDGTFQDGVVHSSAGTSNRKVATGDLNGDGILDVITAEYSGGINVHLGQSGGNFSSATVYSSVLDVQNAVTVGDVNGDGILDVISGGYDSSSNASVAVQFGNGDGSLQAATNYALGLADGVGVTEIRLADMNGDGTVDIFSSVTDTAGSGFIRGLFNNGSGGFTTGATYIEHPIATNGLAVGDLDGDGDNDVASVGQGNTIRIRYNNGDGTMSSVSVISPSTNMTKISFADLNEDGALDIVTSGAASSLVFLGNGDGTFKAKVTYTGAAQYHALEDINGDNHLDYVTVNTTTASVRLGNGDGSFTARATYLTGLTTSLGVAIADTTGDGALDLVVAGVNSGAKFSVLEANTQNITTIDYLDLSTRSGALEAMGVLDATLERISSELGSIGSVQSRLSVAVSNLTVAQENYRSAASQIVDADVAYEAASLVRNQILQQAGAAVLAQANTEPELALSLLNGI